MLTVRCPLGPVKLVYILSPASNLASKKAFNKSPYWRAVVEPISKRSSVSRFLLTIRYDTRCYINVRSKANMSQLNLPHATNNYNNNNNNDRLTAFDPGQPG